MSDNETLKDVQDGVAVVGARSRGPAGPGARDRARRPRPAQRPPQEERAEGVSTARAPAGSTAATASKSPTERVSRSAAPAPGSRRGRVAESVGAPVGSNGRRASGRDSSEGSETSRVDDEADLSETEPSLSRSELRALIRRQRSVKGLTRRAQVALAITCVAAILAAAAFATLWSNANGQNQQRQAVAQVTTTFLLDLTNFKSATVDADFSALQKAADPGSVFAKQAAQTFNSNIRGALIQARASSLGQLRNIYIGNVTGSTAEAYAVVDQSYENSKMTSPAHDVLDLAVNLTHGASGWLISTVTVENSSGTNSSVP
jgi:hypothetical protein